MKGVRAKQARVLRIAAALWFCAASVYAQSTSAPAAVEAPARDVGGAAQAFAEAQEAQLSNDFVRAAQLFELADSLAPSKEALRSAIRNREAAGHPARAATLALVALERYADDPDTVAIANEAIVRAGSDLARLHIACDAPCVVLLDGQAIGPRPIERAEVFVPPGEHRLDARFDSERTVSEQLVLAAGERQARELKAPPRVEQLTPQLAPAERAGLAPVRPARGPAQAPETAGISPWYFAGAGALTVVTATAATAIGLDAIRKRDAYEADPTRERYEDGVESQKWANALWIATAGFAATSVVLLAFTDWDGEEQRTTASISVTPWAANLVVRSSLP